MRKISISMFSVMLFLTVQSCGSNKGSFLLVNKSNEPIIQALVKICGQTIELKDIEISDNAIGIYEVKTDSHFDITVQFQSGNTLHKNVGYVTSGLDFYHEIVISNTDIEIAENKTQVQ